MTTTLTNKELNEKLSGLRQTTPPKDLLKGVKPQERVDKALIILLDTSGSMLSSMEEYCKIDVSWKVFREELMPNMAGWAYGVLGFSSTAYWIVFPCQDTKALTVMSTPNATGATSMGIALRQAYHWASGGAKQARFIMLTDGMPTDMSNDEIISMATEYGIPIDTVGIGAGTHGYDPAFLMRLSQATGGIFTEAGSVKKLANAILELSPKNRPLLGMVKEVNIGA